MQETVTKPLMEQAKGYGELAETLSRLSQRGQTLTLTTLIASVKTDEENFFRSQRAVAPADMERQSAVFKRNLKLILKMLGELIRG